MSELKEDGQGDLIPNNEEQIVGDIVQEGEYTAALPAEGTTQIVAATSEMGSLLQMAITEDLDVEKLEKLIELKDDNLRKQIGINSRNWIKNNFEGKMVIERLVETYKQYAE